MAIYYTPPIAGLQDLRQKKQTLITDASGADGTSGFNTAVNAIIDVLQAYHMDATA